MRRGSGVRKNTVKKGGPIGPPSVRYRFSRHTPKVRYAAKVTQSK